MGGLPGKTFFREILQILFQDTTDPGILISLDSAALSRCRLPHHGRHTAARGKLSRYPFCRSRWLSSVNIRFYFPFFFFLLTKACDRAATTVTCLATSPFFPEVVWYYRSIIRDGSSWRSGRRGVQPCNLLTLAVDCSPKPGISIARRPDSLFSIWKCQ